MEQRCEICRGSQIVRLPRLRPVSVRPFEATAEKIETPWKEYPCPECAPTVSPDQVRVAECNIKVDVRAESERGYREHMVSQGVTELAHFIEENGFMRIQEGASSVSDLHRTYRITVGVVSPKVVADMDSARHAAEDAFANEVVAIADAEINNWGSHYGHADILKRDARRLVHDALAQAKRRRPK